MGFLSRINKKLGFSKGTKERVRALKRREALGLNPKYVEDPMGPIMSPSGRFNQSALDRLIAETESLNPGMGSILNRPSRVPFDGQINEAALQAIQSPGSKDFRAPRMPQPMVWKKCLQRSKSRWAEPLLSALHFCVFLKALI
jgi:hypothetical protein